MPFALTSSAFANGAAIPAVYGCRGADISPPLAWHDAPAGTKSFVLIVEDPDAPAGVFRHWGLYDIPGARAALAQGVATGGLGHAVNDFGRAEYDGPCPPPGPAHHYRFRLAALDRPALALASGVSVAALWQAAQPYVIGEADLTGTYAR